MQSKTNINYPNFNLTYKEVKMPKFFKKLRRSAQKGFTLVELMIVVAIIGILAAIAIPQFASYRQKAFDTTAKSDVKNLMTDVEAYYADNQEYPH